MERCELPWGSFRQGGQSCEKPPATHQPTKAEMEEVTAIDGTLDEIAAAVLKGGASRKATDARQRHPS